jgi:hypothetical protein
MKFMPEHEQLLALRVNELNDAVVVMLLQDVRIVDFLLAPPLYGQIFRGPGRRTLVAAAMLWSSPVYDLGSDTYAMAGLKWVMKEFGRPTEFWLECRPRRTLDSRCTVCRLVTEAHP